MTQLLTHLFIVHDKDDPERPEGNECFWLIKDYEEPCNRLVEALRHSKEIHLGRAAIALLCDSYSYKSTEEDYTLLNEICQVDTRLVCIGSMHRVSKRRLHKIGPVYVQALNLPSLK